MGLFDDLWRGITSFFQPKQPRPGPAQTRKEEEPQAQVSYYVATSVPGVKTPRVKKTAPPTPTPKEVSAAPEGARGEEAEAAVARAGAEAKGRLAAHRARAGATPQRAEQEARQAEQTAESYEQAVKQYEQKVAEAQKKAKLYNLDIKNTIEMYEAKKQALEQERAEIERQIKMLEARRKAGGRVSPQEAEALQRRIEEFNEKVRRYNYEASIDFTRIQHEAVELSKMQKALQQEYERLRAQEMKVAFAAGKAAQTAREVQQKQAQEHVETLSEMTTAETAVVAGQKAITSVMKSEPVQDIVYKTQLVEAQMPYELKTSIMRKKAGWKALAEGVVEGAVGAAIFPFMAAEDILRGRPLRPVQKAVEGAQEAVGKVATYFLTGRPGAAIGYTVGLLSGFRAGGVAAGRAAGGVVERITPLRVAEVGARLDVIGITGEKKAGMFYEVTRKVPLPRGKGVLEMSTKRIAVAAKGDPFGVTVHRGLGSEFRVGDVVTRKTSADALTRVSVLRRIAEAKKKGVDVLAEMQKGARARGEATAGEIVLEPAVGASLYRLTKGSRFRGSVLHDWLPVKKGGTSFDAVVYILRQTVRERRMSYGEWFRATAKSIQERARALIPRKAAQVEKGVARPFEFGEVATQVSRAAKRTARKKAKSAVEETQVLVSGRGTGTLTRGRARGAEMFAEVELTRVAEAGLFKQPGVQPTLVERVPDIFLPMPVAFHKKRMELATSRAEASIDALTRGVRVKTPPKVAASAAVKEMSVPRAKAMSATKEAALSRVAYGEATLTATQAQAVEMSPMEFRLPRIGLVEPVGAAGLSGSPKRGRKALFYTTGKKLGYRELEHRLGDIFGQPKRGKKKSRKVSLL